MSTDFTPGTTAKGTPCKRCVDAGERCAQHRDEPSESVSAGDLSPSQIDALESLVARGVGDTMEDVADRAGVSARTLYRYMRDDAFVSEYRRRVEDELGGHRSRVARALVEGAVSPGKGQASMQKIYWERLGELQHRHQVENVGPPQIVPVASEILMSSHVDGSDDS